MAILFGRMRSISRGHGESAMTAAAYRSCSRLSRIITDKETGIKTDITYDYSNKKGLVFSKILLPKMAVNEEIPDWLSDRKGLWQRIEDVEKRVNSELAKEYVVALPKEFTTGENIKLLEEFVQTSFLSRGMVVDVNYHGDNPNNPHAHIMFPMRRLELNEQGELDFGGKVREWKSFALLNQIKQEQQIIINQYYARRGYEYKLEWGACDGLESTFHHGGIKNLYKRNQEIIAQNASRIISDPSLVIDKLDHNKSVFTAGDIEKEITKALQIDVKHRAGEKYLDHKELLDHYVEKEIARMLNIVLLSPKLTIINGCDLNGKTLFAKAAQVELEERFVSHIKELNSTCDHRIEIDDSDIESLDLGERKIEFTKQQKQVIKSILAGNNISIIEGWPGAGKSTVSAEIVRFYRDRGYEIIAAAPTNKAAIDLGEKLGVKSYTMASLRMKWQESLGYKADISLRSSYYREKQYQNTNPVMSENTILLIDEISMIDTATFDYFASQTLKGGGKLIGLGDNNQNQAIGMKGAACKAIEIAGSNLLTEINRHKNDDEFIRKLHIEASTALSSYQVPKALSIYEELGAIKISESEDLKERSVFSAYIEKLFEISKSENITVTDSYDKVTMIAYTNDEIDRLNEMARNSLKASGVISNHGCKFLSGGIHGKCDMVELSVGDRIIFKSNHLEKNGYGGVMNNDLGVIRRIISSSESGAGEFIADINRDGKVKKVLIKTGEEGRGISFRHGYAISNYGVQGASIDHVMMSIDKQSGYEVSLVGLTRHRKSCQIFAARFTLENEIYRTKDLDAIKVRKEYEAISYIWQGNVKKEVALWKVGLGLLVSKRSNLNFAIDSRYGEYGMVHQSELAAIYWGIDLLKGNLEKHNKEIYEYELSVNSPIGSAYGLDKSKEKYSQIELFALEHFHLDAGDIFFDARSVMSAMEEHSQADKEGGRIEDLVSSLKNGIFNNGSREKIKWRDISPVDQNLLLASYLSAGDKKLLSDHIGKIEKLEDQIRQVAKDEISIIDRIKIESKSSHKGLSGNYAAVRDYLEARGKVGNIYESLKSLDSAFSSGKIQKLLISEIKNNYGIKLKVIDAQIGDIWKVRDKQISKNEPALLARNIFDQTKNKELKELWKKAGDIFSNLDEANSQREKTALVLINNYHGSVDGKKNQLSIGKLLAQSSCNYQTIAKHAKIADERHYFTRIAESTMVHDVYYGKLMEFIIRAESSNLTKEDAKSILELHSKIIESNIVKGKYLEELESQKELIVKEYKEAEKLSSDHKLFKNTEFNYYIGDVYETNRLEVIENFDRLLEKTQDMEQLRLRVSNSPKMLGKLKPYGFLAKLFKSKDSIMAEGKLDIFSDNINKYIDGHIKMIDLQEKMDGKYFHKKVIDLNIEIKELRNSLGNNQEKGLLEEISRIESNNKKGVKLSEENLAKDLGKLFSQDKSLDLLYNWHTYQKKLPKDLEQNLSASIKEKPGRLDFNEVANSLSSNDYELLFRSYVRRIKSDDRIVKRGSSISCGSINMNLQNGLWNRFSRAGDNGNIFGFISYASGISMKESLEVVASHAGILPKSEYNHNSFAPSKKQITLREEIREEWVASKVQENTASFNPEKDLSFMVKDNNLTGTYEYRDIDNNIIGYTVRFEDKVTGKKQILPVSYCYSSEKDKYAWRLKSFKSNGYKPIYKAEKLQKEIKPILIVEGEKTADKAAEILPSHSVISWLGGAKSVDKIDWNLLKGREVVIWPDNDKAGSSASATIKNHLDIVNTYRGLVSIVDTEKLKLPEKWDLADEIPKGLNIKKEISNSCSKEQNLSLTNPAIDKIIESFDFLTAKGEIDIEGVHSTSLYKRSLCLIGAKENIQTDGKNILEIIGSLQDKYNHLKREEEKLVATSRQEKIQKELTMEAVIFQKLLLGQKNLTKIDENHINNTSRLILGEAKHYKAADIKEMGKKLEKEILSDKWQSELADKHKTATKLARAKLATSNIAEFTKLLQESPHQTTLKNNSDIFDKMEKAGNFLKKKVGKSSEDLLKIYKTHGDSESIYQALLKECRTHTNHFMQQQLKAIEQGDRAVLGGRLFNCKKSYLEHLNKYSHNEFLPHREIQAELKQIHQQEHQQQIEHQLFLAR